MRDLNDILVIVRSVGERTTDLSSNLLKDVFPPENVLVLNEKPFSKAIEKSLLIAQERNKSWMLAIDADVLVDKKGVLELIESSVICNKDIHVIQGLIYDKFFNVLRPAGNHLYRVKYAKRAIKAIPAEGTSLRPETDMLNRMAKEGFPWMQIEAIVGIHDFEQSNSDIFRKCFLQSQKHKDILPLVESFWKKKAGLDADFMIAQKAVKFGLKHEGKVYVDKRFLHKEIENELSKLSIPAKDEKVTNVDVEKILKEGVSQIDSELQGGIFPRAHWDKVVDKEYLKKKWSPSFKNKVKDKIKLILRSRK